MSDHPSTFSAENTDNDAVNWNDRAALHREGDGQGLLDGSKALRHATLADLVQHVMLLPEDERRDYAIQKAGDRKFSVAEIEALASRSDYPHAKA